jgi:hypothetical protein
LYHAQAKTSSDKDYVPSGGIVPLRKTKDKVGVFLIITIILIY